MCIFTTYNIICFARLPTSGLKSDKQVQRCAQNDHPGHECVVLCFYYYIHNTLLPTSEYELLYTTTIIIVSIIHTSAPLNQGKILFVLRRDVIVGRDRECIVGNPATLLPVLFTSVTMTVTPPQMQVQVHRTSQNASALL